MEVADELTSVPVLEVSGVIELDTLLDSEDTMLEPTEEGAVELEGWVVVDEGLGAPEGPRVVLVVVGVGVLEA